MSDYSRVKQEKRSQSGAGFAWFALWLVSVTGIVGLALYRYAPTVEKRILTGVQQSIAPLTMKPIAATVTGHQATLTGVIRRGTKRKALLAAAGSSPGISFVVDRMTYSDESQQPSPDIDHASSDLTGNAKQTTRQAPAPEPAVTMSDNATRSTPTEAPYTTALDTLVGQAGSVDQSDAVTALSDPATAGKSSYPPSLSLVVNNKVMSIQGQLSKQDDVEKLVDAAMSSFNLDYVANSIEANDDTTKSDWMQSISALLPSLSRLKNPGIDIVDRQITLTGIAPDQKTHDAVIDDVLLGLGSFALIAHIDIATTPTSEPANQPSAPETPDVPDAPETPDVPDAPETPDVPDAPETPDVPDAPETPDVPDAPETPDVPDAPETPDVPDAPETPDVPDAPETPDVPDAPETPDVPDAPETPDVPDAPETPDVPDAPETPDVPERPDAPESTISAGVASVAKARAGMGAAFSALQDQNILFETNRDVLTENSLKRLDEIAEILRSFPNIPVAIGGHTDATGPAKVNLQLSQLRANAVRDYLESQGVSVLRLSSYGYGEKLPIADNKTAKGRAANRRIEFNY